MSDEKPSYRLLTGPEGVGKATFAFRIARFVLSQGLSDAGSDGGVNLWLVRVAHFAAEGIGEKFFGEAAEEEVFFFEELVLKAGDAGEFGAVGEGPVDGIGEFAEGRVADDGAGWWTTRPRDHRRRWLAGVLGRER